LRPLELDGAGFEAEVLFTVQKSVATDSSIFSPENVVLSYHCTLLLQKFHTRQLKSQSFYSLPKVIPYVEEGKIEPEYFLSLLASNASCVTAVLHCNIAFYHFLGQNQRNHRGKTS
jgi:hypothetical protein